MWGAARTGAEDSRTMPAGECRGKASRTFSTAFSAAPCFALGQTMLCARACCAESIEVERELRDNGECESTWTRRSVGRCAFPLGSAHTTNPRMSNVNSYYALRIATFKREVAQLRLAVKGDLPLPVSSVSATERRLRQARECDEVFGVIGAVMKPLASFFCRCQPPPDEHARPPIG